MEQLPELLDCLDGKRDSFEGYSLRYCPFKVGDSVDTVFGEGSVIALRTDGIVEVQAANWSLANGQVR